MAAYEAWAPFYDLSSGDRTEQAAYVQELLQRHRPETRTLLELGCGTGAVLEQLGGYDLTGLDLSRDMLRIARRKVPGAHLVYGDMTAFRLDRRFDAIVCISDGINHLRPYSAWEAVFARAHEHLEDGGVFVFDMNTELHLSQLAAEPALTSWSDEGHLSVVDVLERGRDGVLVEVNVFERRPNGSYRRHTAAIPEISYPAERVRESLRRRFRLVRAYDRLRARPSDRSERLHFVCVR